jgi:hypothetical protein
MLTGVAAGKDQPVDGFGVTHVRLDEGDSHRTRLSAWRARAANLTACLNVTPAPKLNRYAESAVLTFIVNETKMLAARTLDAYEKSPKVSEVPH